MHLPDWLRYIGLLILILGLVLGLMALLQLKTYLSPFPTPVAHGTLVDNGVYKVSRHPIYTALIFSGLGYAIYQVSLYKMIISLALLVLFYFKSKYEEELLTKTYSRYANYKKKTRRFI
jgi:protein-S-isoprenylcysteine O-methyltransferase Ste14